MSQDLFATVVAAIVAAAGLAVWGYIFASTADQPAVRAVITFGAYSPAGYWRLRLTRGRHRNGLVARAARTVAGWFWDTVNGIKTAILWAMGEGLEKPAPGWEPRGDWWNEFQPDALRTAPVDDQDGLAEAARQRRYARLTAGDNGAVPLELDLDKRYTYGGPPLASFNADPGAAAERLSRHLAAGDVRVARPMSEVEREFRAAVEPRRPLQFEVDGKTGESADVAAGYGWLPDRVRLESAEAYLLPPRGLIIVTDELEAAITAAMTYDDGDNAPITAQDVADAEAVARVREAARAELAAALVEVDHPADWPDQVAEELFPTPGPVEHEGATEDWSAKSEVGADEKPVTLSHTPASLAERDILAEFDACVEDARTLPPWLVALAVTVDEDMERAGKDARAHGAWRQTWLSMPTGEWRPVAPA